MNLIDVVYCTVCRKPMSASEPVCPSCGADQRAARAEQVRAVPPVHREGHPVINRVIAAAEMLGSILGVYVLITFGARAPAISLCLIAFQSVSCLLAGVWLWSGKPLGIRVSLAIQAMQILFFALPAFTYVWLAGPALYMGLYIGPVSRVGFMYGLYSRIVLGPNYMPAMAYVGFVTLPAISVPGTNILVGVNYVPLAFAAYLLRQVIVSAADARSR